MVVRETYEETIMEATQSELHLVNNWFSRQGLSLNPRKTIAVAFTRNLVLDRLRLPCINGVEIPLVNEVPGGNF